VVNTNSDVLLIDKKETCYFKPQIIYRHLKGSIRVSVLETDSYLLHDSVWFYNCQLLVKSRENPISLIL